MTALAERGPRVFVDVVELSAEVVEGAVWLAEANGESSTWRTSTSGSTTAATISSSPIGATT